MTKLKQPIVVTITHVENAVSHCLGEDVLQACKLEPRHKRINRAASEGEISNQIESALLAQGVNWKTWEPPQPIKAFGHSVVTYPDGSIGTTYGTLTRPTLEAIFKLSSEAMGVKAESEWPKFYRCNKCVIRFDNATDFGTWECNCTNEKVSNSWNLELVTKNSDFKPLTPQAAREILEAKG